MDNFAVSNLIRTCTPTVPRDFFVVNASTSAPKRLTTYTLSGITRAGTTATGTTAAAHYLRAGDTVVISGANEAGYNGEFTVVTVPTSSTFTFAVPNDGGVAAATGTLVCYGKIWFRSATFYGRKTDVRTDSTDVVWLGCSSVNGEQNVPVGAGGEVVWAAAVGCRLGLHDLYLDPIVVSEGVSISFH